MFFLFVSCSSLFFFFFFFFNDTATTEIYTLSLHDALPISPLVLAASITTDQPPRLDDLGQPIPEYAVLGIDQAAGIISLELRADKPRGQARTYWITVTATDTGGNSTHADVTVLVPHDQRRP